MIAISGPNGIGKTNALKNLKKILFNHGIDIIAINSYGTFDRKNTNIKYLEYIHKNEPKAFYSTFITMYNMCKSHLMFLSHKHEKIYIESINGEYKLLIPDLAFDRFFYDEIAYGVYFQKMSFNAIEKYFAEIEKQFMRLDDYFAFFLFMPKNDNPDLLKSKFDKQNRQKEIEAWRNTYARFIKFTNTFLIEISEDDFNGNFKNVAEKMAGTYLNTVYPNIIKIVKERVL